MLLGIFEKSSPFVHACVTNIDYDIDTSKTTQPGGKQHERRFQFPRKRTAGSRKHFRAGGCREHHRAGPRVPAVRRGARAGRELLHELRRKDRRQRGHDVPHRPPRGRAQLRGRELPPQRRRGQHPAALLHAERRRLGREAQAQAPPEKAQDRAHAGAKAAHHAHRVPVSRVRAARRPWRRRDRGAHHPLRQDRRQHRLELQRHARDAAGQLRPELRLGHLQSGVQAGRRHHDGSDLHQLLRPDQLPGELRQRLFHHG